MSTKITDVYLRKLTGIAGKTQRIAVGNGLFLWLTINRGGNTAKVWYLRYYDEAGKQQRSKLGTYPELSLAQAQAQAENAKKAGKDGIRLAQVHAEARRVKIEGSQEAQAAKLNTFEVVAEKWLAEKSLHWVDGHLKRQKERLQGHLFNALGNKPVNEIGMADIIGAIRPLVIEGKIETAKRSCDLVRNVLEYADLLGELENSSIPGKVAKYRKEIPTSPTKRNYYQEMTEDQIAALLRGIEASKLRWTKSTSVAIRLAPYVFLRAKELAEAEWPEINLDNAEWLIPARRMKERREHLVPLSRQAIELLKEIEPLSRGGKYVFPSQSKRNEPITTNALIQVLRRLGYKSTREDGESFVTHGFRGLASTILYQKLGYPGDHIEHQLAHAESNKIKAAYNQIGIRSYLEERRMMMQAYANYLDSLREKYASSTAPV